MTLEKAKKDIFNCFNDSENDICKKILESINDDVIENWNKKKFELFGIQKIQKSNDENPIIKDMPIGFDNDLIEYLSKNNINDKTELLDKVYEYLTIQKNILNEKAINFMGIGNNGGYFIGLFGYLLEKDFDTIVDEISKVYNFSSKSILENLKRSIETIKQYAKNLPEKPSLTEKWFDYRIHFNGKYQSWANNRLGKINIAQIDLFDLNEKLNKKLEDKKIGNSIEIKKSIEDVIEFIEPYIPKKVTKTGFSMKQNKEIEITAEKENDIKNDIKKGSIEKKVKDDDRAKNEITDVFSKELNRRLSNLNEEINKFYQTVDSENKKAEFKEIQSAPRFYGEANQEYFSKVLNLKESVKKQIYDVSFLYEEMKELINEEYELKETSDEVENLKKSDRYEGLKKEEKQKKLRKLTNKTKYIQNLANCYKLIKYTSNKYFNIDKDANSEILKYLEGIAKKLNIDFDDNDLRHKFFLTGHERGKFSKLDISNSISVKELLKIVDVKFILSNIKEKFNSENYFRDSIQFLKTIFSIIIAAINEDDELSFDVKKFENNFGFIEIKNINQLNKLTNQIFSDLSGKNAILSRENFIVRYDLQVVGKTKGGVTTNDNKKMTISGTLTSLAKSGSEYYYAFKGIDKNNENSVSLTNIQGKDGKDNGDCSKIVEADIKLPALKVCSSKYQINFLNWFYNKDGKSAYKKRKCYLEYMGNFLIAEKSYGIDYNEEKLKIEPKSDSDNLFVSQPFKLVSKKKNDSRSGKKWKVSNVLVGIDVGEYALTYCILDKEKRDEIIDSGEIIDKQQRAVIDYVKEKRASTAKQTFTDSDTKIARLRKSLIGAFKNRLQSLKIKHKATLIFEGSISAFETGSNRIVKIYDSVKGADIYKSINPVDKQTRKQAYGEIKGKKNQFDWAIEIAAYGTSQICSKCGRWYLHKNVDVNSNDIPKDEEHKNILNNKIYDVVKVENNIGYVETDLGNIRFFDNGSIKKNNDGQNQIKGEDLKKSIYKAMRPPYYDASEKKIEYSAGSEIIKNIINSKVDEDNKGKFPLHFNSEDDFLKFAKRRGNTAIYICPFEDCHHIADADLQAAYNIAIRGIEKHNDFWGNN